MPSIDRSLVVSAVTGAALVTVVAYAHPALIPALAVGLAAFMALAVLLKL